MDSNDRKSISNSLLKIIQKYVSLSGFSISHDDISSKIDLVERILEILRIENKYLDNNLPMERFIQGRLDIDQSGIHFSSPKILKDSGSGTAPIRFQPKLLLFLFFRHNRGRYKVYDIIDSFIKTVWDSLETVDFKKTKTGVMRCFTNTRFAANTLRDYGFLKFTKKEAYKTWVLSLSGLLVASKLIENVDWSLPKVDKEWKSDLHPDVREVFNELKTYDKFVDRLTKICKPNTKIFEDFKKGSIGSYSLLDDYWKVLQDQSLSKNERKKRSSEIIGFIEEDPEIEKFFKEFSRCIKVGDLLGLK